MRVGKGILGAVLLLSLGCDGKDGETDSQWREVADDTEALADASDAVQLEMDACSDAFDNCLAGPEICVDALEACLGDALDDLPGIDPRTCRTSRTSRTSQICRTSRTCPTCPTSRICRSPEIGPAAVAMRPEATAWIHCPIAWPVATR